MKRFLPLVLVALCAACSSTTTTTTTEEVRKQIDSAASSAPAAAFKDGLIAAAIKAKLASDDIDSAMRVHVAVKDGHVRISGVTRQPAQVDIATRDAKGIAGVRSVENVMTTDTKLGKTTDEASDFGLRAKVTAELAAQTGVNAAAIKVSAHAGVVTLTGRVSSAAIKATMLETVRNDHAVRSLVDKIAVRPT